MEIGDCRIFYVWIREGEERVSKMGERGSKSILFNMRMTPKEYADLECLSYEVGKTMSDVVREAIELYSYCSEHFIKSD